MMIFAFAECEEPKDLLTGLTALIFCVAALHAELPVEFDSFKCREVISLRVLSLELESFWCFL